MLSHKKALETAKSKRWQYVMILEDDVEFPDGFDSKLEHLLQNAPTEFDMLFLHGTYGRFGKPEKANDYFHRVRELYGAFGYIVSRAFYERLIEALEANKESLTTDYIYSMLMRKAKVFRAIKPIVFHRPGYSYRAERVEKMYKHLELK